MLYAVDSIDPTYCVIEHETGVTAPELFVSSSQRGPLLSPHHSSHRTYYPPAVQYDYSNPTDCLCYLYHEASRIADSF
jgi:hypothetical protein